MKKIFSFVAAFSLLFLCFHANTAGAESSSSMLNTCLNENKVSLNGWSASTDMSPTEYYNKVLSAFDCFLGKAGRMENGPGWFMLKTTKSFAQTETGIDLMNCRATKENCQAAFVACNSNCTGECDCTKSVQYPCQISNEIACEQEFAAQLRAKASKLESQYQPKNCSPFEYFVDGKCQTVANLCGNDSLLQYDAKTGQCSCPDGYEYKNRACVAKDNGECLNTEIKIDGQCKKISDLCGYDSNINYDAKTGQCFCPQNYTLKTENGQKSCQEEGEINLTIKVVDGSPNPPLLANGKTETKFLVHAANKTTGKNINLNFDIGYARTDKKGTISTSGDSSGYTITYKTADLGEIEGQPVDYLYIYYDKNGKRGRESYPIELYTEASSMMTISHIGFDTVSLPLVFKGKTTKVYVYTIVGGQEVPANNAKILYENDWIANTNEDGMATLKARKTVYGTEENQQQAELKLAAQLEEWRDEAKEKYAKIDLFNNSITEFLTGFGKEIARAGSEQAANQKISALRDVKYALVFIDHGNVFGRDCANMVGDTTGDLIWDSYEFVSNLIDLNGKIINKIKENSSALGLAADQNSLLRQLLAKTPESFALSLERKLSSSITSEAPRLNPMILSDFFDEIFGQQISGQTKENLNALSIQKILADRLYGGHLEFDKKIIQQIANKIQKGDFESYQYMTDANIALAKAEYFKFTDSYQLKNEMDYEATFIKDSSDLFRATILKGVQLAVPALKQIASTIDKVMDGLDVAFQGARVNAWYNAFGQNEEMVAKAAQNLVGAASSQVPAAKTETLLALKTLGVSTAFAQEHPAGDMLQTMYENEVAGGHPDRQIVLDYYQDQADLALYENINAIIDIAGQIDPQDEEAQEIKNEISAQMALLQSKVDENAKKVANLDILKPVKKPDDNPPVAIPLGRMAANLVLIICGAAAIVAIYKKKLKDKTKKVKVLAVSGMVVALYIIVGILDVVLINRFFTG